MQHIYGLAAARLEQPSLVTIGVFDGVHRGHQHLLRRLVAQAHANGQLAVVQSFFPHPDVVLRGLSGRYYLTAPEQKTALLAELGVDVLVTEAFDATLREVRAGDYVDLLLNRLQMRALWVGPDFALGYRREGDAAYLRQRGAQSGFELHVVDLLADGGPDAIRSTTIRQALRDGDVEQARALLGRPYAVTGPVVHGERRGHRIGFPTANIGVWAQQAIPANGVYAGWATLGAQKFMAVTNIGVRPTFDGQDVTVEAYLLDFKGSIYGQQLTLTFERRLRPEQKFSGIDALVAQIRADAEAARVYLSESQSLGTR
jgi:riboflavin kinase/FMN adenylyltransferase